MMMMHNFFGDNLFDNENWPDTSFDREFFAKMNPLYGKHAKDVMLTDVKRTDDKYEVVMDLPGFKKEDVQINLNKGYLTHFRCEKRRKERRRSRHLSASGTLRRLYAPYLLCR